MKSTWWKSLLAMSTLSMLAIPSVASAATNDGKMHININGTYQQYDVNPFVQNNRTLVPLRGIFESLGVKVTWTPSKPLLIVASKGDTTITMTMNTNYAYINGQKVTLDVASTVKNNRTFVPVRFISEAMGADVTWDPPTNDVNIVSDVYPVGQYTNRQALNLPIVDDVETLDPAKANDNISIDVLAQTNEGLTRLDSQGKIVPGVAKSWTVSPDGLTYTFTLRDDAKWSDGSTVTAHDFEYAWKRVVDPKMESQYSYLFDDIIGVNELKMHPEEGSSVVQVTAQDDHTLVVHLGNPQPYFTELTSFPVFFPVKQSFVEQKGAAFGNDFKTTLFNGPFKMSAWVHGRYSLLTQNTSYWDHSAVKLNKVGFTNVGPVGSPNPFTMYQNGLLDRLPNLIGNAYDTYKNAPGFQSVPQQTLGYVAFNEQIPLLANVNVRKALSDALDANAYASATYRNGSVGATGFIPTGVSGVPGTDFRTVHGDVLNRQTNVSQAKALLTKGMTEVGVTTFPRLTLLMDESSISRIGGPLLQKQWHDTLGIDVNIQYVPFQQRLDAEQYQNYQMSLSLWGADYDDPSTFLDLFRTGDSFNKFGYSNHTYDNLLAQAEASTDEQQRMDLYAQVEQILSNDTPVAPLFFFHQSNVLQPYVKNFVTHPWGAEYDLKTTYISK